MNKEIHFLEDGYYVDKLEKDIEKLKKIIDKAGIPRNKIKGYLYQEYEPNPDKPCEIKTMLCNDIEIPVEYLKQTFVIVDGKKYIELQQESQQLKEELKIKQDDFKCADEEINRLKEVIEEVRKYIESDPLVVVSEYDYYVNDLIQMEKSSIRMSFIGTLLQILDKAGDINEKKN